MAQLVRKHIENLDNLEETIKEDADKILEAINIDDFLKDPESYLLLLGDAFLKEHIDEIENAHKEGKRFAKEIIENI